MTRRKKEKSAGMALVEFALVFPIVIALAMGIIETGNIMFSWMTLQKAAQEGARVAVTGQGDEEGTRMLLINEAAEKLLVELKHGTKTITVRSWSGVNAEGSGVEGNAGRPCQLVEVAVLYNYKPFVPIINTIFPEVIPLQGSDRKVNEPWEPCEEQ